MATRSRKCRAFLSYVHADDLNDSGRITQLRRRLESEIRMQLGEDFSIFQDKENILVGQQWRTQIENTIDETTLLISIITPSYLNSEECRKEVELFLDRERQLERDDLIIPVLYLETASLHNDEHTIAQALNRRQHFDWARFRFEDFESNEVRKGLSELANQVIGAIHRSRIADRSITVPESDSLVDKPGLVEQLATAEEAIPNLTVTINALSETTVRINEYVSAATEEIEAANSTGRPASVRLSIIHRLSKRLEQPVYNMEGLANEYLDQVSMVGGAIDLFIERLPSIDQSELESATEFDRALETMKNATLQAFESLKQYQEVLVRNYSLSSTLRPILKRIHTAIGKILTSRSIIEEWYEDYHQMLNQRLGDG